MCNIPDFDVTKQLPQDIMHIFLEGVLSYELKFLLKYYFDAGLITLDQLNTKLKNFIHGYSNVKDKPSFIKQDDMDFTLTVTLAKMQLKCGSYLGSFLSFWRTSQI